MLKYLRIAATALSLTACVLLVGLWVRSYYRLDTVSSWPGHTVSSLRGKLFADAEFLWVTGQSTMQSVRFFPGTSVPTGSNRKALKPYVSGIPIWLVIMLTASIAAAPWIRWSRRFSLRTLLIATTLVAVGLAVMTLSN